MWWSVIRPYVQLQKDEGRLANRYKDAGFETFVRKGDIYQLFIEKGCHLLCSSTGVLCYITSNSWLKAESGRKTRSYLSQRHGTLQLLEMGKDVFNAIVDACVLLVRESRGSDHFRAVDMDDVHDHLLPPRKDRWGEVRPQGAVPWSILTDKEWKVFDKMGRAGTALKKWDVKINFGIKTGLNEAFIIDDHTRNYLIEEDSGSKEIILPVLRGRDIRRWRTQWAEKWLIATFPALRLDIDDYPAVKSYLLAFGKEQLEQSGSALPNGRKTRKKTSHAWYELQDSIAFHKDFGKEKLLWIELAEQGRFAYDDTGMVGEATTFILTGESIKYLCCVLNSNAARWYVQQTAPTSGMGALRWKKVLSGSSPYS